jgi:hypothetical protein
MDKFLDMYDLPKLIQEDISNLNRSIVGNETEIEAVIKSLPTMKSHDQMDPLVNSTRSLKKNEHQCSPNNSIK